MCVSICWGGGGGSFVYSVLDTSIAKESFTCYLSGNAHTCKTRGNYLVCPSVNLVYISLYTALVM